eukprot:Gb_36894 [translate_table: standard]
MTIFSFAPYKIMKSVCISVHALQNDETDVGAGWGGGDSPPTLGTSNSVGATWIGTCIPGVGTVLRKGNRLDRRLYLVSLTGCLMIISSREIPDAELVQDFRHEVELLVKLRHPNIVQFLGAVTKTPPLMLITEFLRGGDLHQFLKEKGALPTSTSVNFALDIARPEICILPCIAYLFELVAVPMGMTYLHNGPNVIIHRDLKPRNVLMVNSNHLKVGDFGLSKLINVKHAHDMYKLTGETGSYRYMAPEVFEHKWYDTKVDVFSFAMILYEMFEGVAPFANRDAYEAAKIVAKGDRPIFRARSYPAEMKE